MPEDQYFRPRNWTKFQSRSNNSMAWVKNHTALLQDPDYLNLSPPKRAILHGLWMLFGIRGKPLPLSSTYLGRALGIPSQTLGNTLKPPSGEPGDNLGISFFNDFMELCESTENLHSELPPLEEKRVDKRRKKEPSISPLQGDTVFQEFWNLYPRQRRGNKQKTFRAWQRATERAPPGDIILGCRAYCESDEVRRGFAKGAAAWLNDDRWATDYQTFREQTAAEQLEDWVNGDTGDDSRGGTIDGDCVEVPEHGPESDGNGLLPCAEGFERRGHQAGGRLPTEQLGQDGRSEAGGPEGQGERVAALVAQATKARKA